ncbi:hypothetical protein HYV89_05680 [Candidatus Woesearchaeota archaeon]|nr:hypothetical protein [Candidatus Woesearchaeota archaeon]
MTERKYKRHRKKSPSLFIKSSFRTVPLSHTNYKDKLEGKAIVGKLKKTKKWEIQNILEERDGD